MSDLITLVILIVIGYVSGSIVERAHYASIARREERSSSLAAVTGEDFLADMPVGRAELVCANIALSADYFKLIVSGLRNLLGGEVTVHESILDRARREAVLRLKEKAPGADIIVNLRIETCTIGDQGSVQAIAYGTAVYYG